MNKNSKIFIAGHRGMVGSAIHRKLLATGFRNLLVKPRQELNLANQQDVEAYFSASKPEYVILAAAKVGGILANNTYRAEFIYENLMIQNNVIHAAWKNNVKKLLFLGSSCIYPKAAPQPIKEGYLLEGPLESTNEPYAIAKIAGIKMCENYFRQYGCNFISVMPTNLYGPNDNYDLEKSHVLPAIIRKMHLAGCIEQDNWDAVRTDLERFPVGNITGKSPMNEIIDMLASHGISSRPGNSSARPGTVTVTLWGTGNVYREFLHVDDMASACVHIMQNINAQELYNSFMNSHINIGTGADLTIKELAYIVKSVTGFGGVVSWDASKPDGTPRKQLDVELLHKLGWKHEIELEAGIRSVYESYKSA